MGNTIFSGDMQSLTQYLSDIFGQAFETLGADTSLGLVRVSDRPDLAQFQCNGAMAAAKVLGKNPREIAQDLIDVVQANNSDVFSVLEIAGPGFINIKLNASFLQDYLAKNGDFKVNVGDGTVIVDYGGMNVAKAMHVGHLRPTVIGHCIKNLYRFCGYEALGDIHLGDWGLQMGQIISEFEIRHPEWPYFDANFDGDYPEQAPFSYADLEYIYPEASAACKADAERLEIARKATAELQNGRAGYIALWQKFLELSIQDIKGNLEPLGVDFEIWKGESDVRDMVEGVQKSLEESGAGIVSDGAFVVPVEEEGDKKDMPPLMYLKSDGAVTYGTTDLLTLIDRVQTYDDLAKIVYVTDVRQSLHFEQVFRAARKAGYADDLELVHIGNGTVNGADGKPYKTREGKALRFSDMIEAAIGKARVRLKEAEIAKDVSEAEFNEIAQRIAVSALLFNELSNQAHVNYVFDLDRMISFEGKTGPYVLYQAVRIQSLLRKLGDVGAFEGFVFEEADTNLVLALLEFPDQIRNALENHAPHSLCEYVYKLAQEFSRFYSQCHIASEENEALKASRVELCRLAFNAMEHILDVLGITIPEKM